MGDKIRDVTCGRKHTIVVTEKNSVYTFGTTPGGSDELLPKKVALQTCQDDWMIWAGGDRSFVGCVERSLMKNENFMKKYQNNLTDRTIEELQHVFRKRLKLI